MTTLHKLLCFTMQERVLCVLLKVSPVGSTVMSNTSSLKTPRSLGEQSPSKLSLCAYEPRHRPKLLTQVVFASHDKARSSHGEED